MKRAIIIIVSILFLIFIVMLVFYLNFDKAMEPSNNIKNEESLQTVSIRNKTDKYIYMIFCFPSIQTSTKNQNNSQKDSSANANIRCYDTIGLTGAYNSVYNKFYDKIPFEKKNKLLSSTTLLTLLDSNKAFLKEFSYKDFIGLFSSNKNTDEWIISIHNEGKNIYLAPEP